MPSLGLLELQGPSYLVSVRKTNVIGLHQSSALSDVSIPVDRKGMSDADGF